MGVHAPDSCCNHYGAGCSLGRVLSESQEDVSMFINVAARLHTHGNSYAVLLRQR